MRWRICQIFKLRREERLPALIMLAIICALNALVLTKYASQFTIIVNDYWKLFINGFHISGFDPISYVVISDWSEGYNVYRHPLLAFFMYVPYLLNQALIWLTGINCAIFIMAAIQIICGFYSFVFILRIFTDVIEISRRDAILLSYMFFSFAYVMIASMVPDHFVISMMLLLFVLWVSGRHIKSGSPMNIWQSIILFLLTAGTTLNNGLKVFFAEIFANKRRFFRPAYLIFAVILPAMIIWHTANWEYRSFIRPHEKERMEEKKLLLAKEKKLNEEYKLQKGQKNRHEIKRKRVQTIKPISNKMFLQWTDVTTPRVQSATENLFGESIMLHPDHLLGDVLKARPIIVYYRWAANYVIEALIVILFIIGVFYGRRNKFLWLVMSFFFLDMILHFGLGFGLDEVYIMSPHWIYAIPIAAAYIFKCANKRWLTFVRPLTFILTLTLFIYNITFILRYLNI
jgi:hypothetical protein